MKKINYSIFPILAVAALFVLVGPSRASAAIQPVFGALGTYGVVSETFTNSNTSPYTQIFGDVCATTQPTTVPLLISGITSTPCAPAIGDDQTTALADLNAQATASCTSILTTGLVATNNLNEGDIDGAGASPAGTYTTGCYKTVGAMNVTTGTTVTLTGAGTYIFKSTGGAITTGADSEVVLVGASACDVFWTPVAATTLGANSTFIGTVIDAAGISIGDTVTWTGRALAYGGTVTSDGDTVDSVNTITVPACTNPASLTVTKTVINNNGRTKVVSDFPLFVGATSIVSGILNNFAAAVYAITETIDTNYVQSFGGDCDTNGNITLSADGSYLCTITNDDTAIPNPGGHRRDIVITYVAPVATTTPFVAPPYFYIPSFPNTGFPPAGQGAQGNMVILFGFLALVSASLVIVSRKQTS